MYPSFRGVLTAAGLLLTLSASAQRRLSVVTALQPKVQLEVALAGNDYVLAEASLFGTTGHTYDDDTVLKPELNMGYIGLGYEHFWNEHWSGGATFRFVGRYREGSTDPVGLPGHFTPGVLLRHRGVLGPVTLGQRLGIEYGFSPNSYRFLEEDKNRAFARLRLDAEHIFALGEKLSLRPRLSYEPIVYLRFQRDQNQLKERLLDFGSLRGEVGLRVSPHFDLTPWVAYQTVYRNFLPFYQPGGGQANDTRDNFVTPVVGLDLRFTLFTAGTSADRTSLPSQH